MFSSIAPHVCIERIEELTLQRLHELAIESLLIDVDCTLKRYHAEEVTPEVAAWLERLRGANIGVCLVSNGRGKRIGRFAERLGLPYVAKALKPLPRGCRAAMRKMNFEPRQTAMVGDQLFADIMAGRFAGLTTILVRPLHAEDEPWFARMKRPVERLFYRWMGVER